MTETERLALPLIAEAQAQKHITHNEALLKLDVLVQMAVEDDLMAPPDAPAEGQAWIVAAGATGDWAGHDGEVAAWQGGVWRYYHPAAGWIAWVKNEDRLMVHDGSAWSFMDAATLGGRPASDYVTADELETVSGGDADTVDGRHADEFALLSGAAFSGAVGMPMIGVQAAADATNRIVVKSDAVLFSHDDVSGGGSGDVRFKVNKSGVANTASLLFQTGWSGRAEVGVGSDDLLRLRASADGSTWMDGLALDPAAGVVRMEAPARLQSCALGALPDPVAAGGGALIHVVDEAGQSGGIAWSDGAVWRRMIDNQIID